MPLAWVALESPDEAARAGRASAPGAPASGLDVLSGSTRTSPRRRLAVLAVGAGASKFGMTETEIDGRHRGRWRTATAALRPRGIHLHVGSQLGAVDAWRDAVRRGLAVAALLRGGIETFDTLDVGGGFPVGAVRRARSREPEPLRPGAPRPLLDAIPADRRPTRLAVEPGPRARRAVGLARRRRPPRPGSRRPPGRHRCRDDRADPAGAVRRPPPDRGADLARRRPIARTAATSPDPASPTRVEGPICESTDALGIHDLPPLRRGDLVAIRDAGAYAASLASTYNGRPRAPQVVIEMDGRLRLARRAMTLTVAQDRRREARTASALAALAAISWLVVVAVGPVVPRSPPPGPPFPPPEIDRGGLRLRRHLLGRDDRRRRGDDRRHRGADRRRGRRLHAGPARTASTTEETEAQGPRAHRPVGRRAGRLQRWPGHLLRHGSEPASTARSSSTPRPASRPPS